ncbi:MAG: hypothetical protein NTX79_04490 [Candidatus Micrarchaeota archaeon]|nr:hypothetical protein [Candidatus Micrarchaeota archaeon]
MRQFWHESVTGESFKLLQKLATSHDFVLIGGWAAYLHTRTQKSKDIDIVVGFDGLRKLDAAFSLVKNERLRKYEIKQGEVDVDVYVPKFSRLSYPPEKLLAGHETIDGIKVASLEQLLLLKLGAYEARKGSAKGEKDAIDIVALLVAAKFDREKFARAARDASVEKPMETLRQIAGEFPDSALPFVGISFVDFKKWRKGFLKE